MIFSQPLEKDVLSYQAEDVFSLSHDLYTQKCDEQNSVVCNPTQGGQVAVLDEEAFALLERFRTPASPSVVAQGADSEQICAIIPFLRTLGFLQPATQLHSAPSQEPLQTLSAWLHITNACNLSCDYCYVDKSPAVMTEDTARNAIDAIFRSALKNDLRTIQLRYAGGEASLQSERIIALHDYAATLAQQHNKELQASLLTNGVFLSQRFMDQLKQRGIGIMISLDGVGAQHDRQRPFANGRGSFHFVDRTITLLLAKKLTPHISVTVSLRNLSGLPELLSYILARELTFSLNYYRENDCSTSRQDLHFTDRQMIEGMHCAFAVIERQLPQRSLLSSLIDKADLSTPHQRTCGVGHNYLAIDQKGGIAKCHAAIKQTVTTIAAADPLHVLRTDQQGVRGHRVDEKQGCRTCSWRYWCSGGCPLLTYRATGRSDVQSPNCAIYKALFPAALRLEGLRLLQYVSPVPLSASSAR